MFLVNLEEGDCGDTDLDPGDLHPIGEISDSARTGSYNQDVAYPFLRFLKDEVGRLINAPPTHGARNALSVSSPFPKRLQAAAVEEMWQRETAGERPLLPGDGGVEADRAFGHAIFLNDGVDR